MAPRAADILGNNIDPFAAFSLTSVEMWKWCPEVSFICSTSKRPPGTSRPIHAVEMEHVLHRPLGG